MIHRLLVLIVAIFTLFFFFGDILIHPNDHMFNTRGDGLKNYFTYAYHINHDSTHVNFEGMNYPYGEHFFYTDCHPALVLPLKSLATTFPIIQQYSIGILNIFMLLGILFTFLVLYELMRAYNIHPYVAIVFSIAITFLAPQLFRLEGHYALSYSLAIPLSWWLFRLSEKKGILFGIFLLLNNAFWLFIHAYLGMILISFLLVLFLLQYIFIKDFALNIRRRFTMVFAIFAPLLIFYSIIVLTDTHPNRTNNPAGFFLYNAELDDIFVPHHGLLRAWLENNVSIPIKQEFEAWSYVGVATVMFCLFTVVMALISIFSKKIRTSLANYFGNQSLNLTLLAAFIVLLFSMGIPFVQFPDLIDSFPIFKQFRATGRFTWPFYFTLLVLFASFLSSVYRKFESKGGKIFISCIILLSSGLLCAEGLPYFRHVSDSISNSKNLFHEKSLSIKKQNAIAAVGMGTYQAILPLPFYHAGSESYSRPRNDESERNSMVLSYHSGLPMFSAALTRISIDESKNIIQMLSPNFYKKKIENDLKSVEDILIVQSSALSTSYEQDIINKANIVFNSPDLKLYRLKKNLLFENKSKEYIINFEDEKKQYFEQNDFFSVDSNAFIYYDGFELTPSAVNCRGIGAFHSMKKGVHEYARFKPNTFRENQDYHISMWMYNGEKDALNLWFRFIVEEIDSISGESNYTTFFPEHASVIDGNWTMVEGYFRVNNSNNRVNILSIGKENSKAEHFADDLLIIEKGNEVYKYDYFSNTLLYNNQRLSF